MRRVFSVALALASVSAFASPASASLVYDSTILLKAEGFGNAPRDLSVQAKANGTTESGCVGVGAGGAITFGTCISDLVVHDRNFLGNVGGDEVNPQDDNQKFGIPTIAELGWNSAADIGLLFNADEAQNDVGGISVDDITLKFYSSTGVLLAAIDGQHQFANSDPGTGIAGFVFVVDALEQTYLNNVIFNQPGRGTYHIALESTLSGVSGGPDTWLAVNLHAVPEPATWALMLLGFGGIGMALRRNRKRAPTLMQIA